MIAASALSLALRLMGDPSWSATLQSYTQYSEDQLAACVLDIWMLAAKENPKYRAVRKKYSAPKFHCVAKIPIGIPVPQPNGTILVQMPAPAPVPVPAAAAAPAAAGTGAPGAAAPGAGHGHQ